MGGLLLVFEVVVILRQNVVKLCGEVAGRGSYRKSNWKFQQQQGNKKEKKENQYVFDSFSF